MAKDMHLRDILVKPVKVAQQVSEYRNGIWSFVTLSNPVKVVESVQYYYMSNKFGVTSLAQTLPSRTMARAMGGNYVAFDTLNNTVLSLIHI